MKIKLKIILLILLPLSLYSHSVLLNVMDNEDGTIMVSGAFNTGESAAGALVKIIATSSDEILYQERLGIEGEVNVQIPKIPYKIILDGGEGHTTEKDGIPPKEGFIIYNYTKEEKSESLEHITSKAVTISIFTAFILFFATIIVSARNTNKLIRELKNNR